MKALLTFADAIAESLRLRILCLSLAHKLSPSETASVLKLGPAEMANQLKKLLEAGLLKVESKSGLVRVKGKHRQLMEELFSHFNVSAKKDAILKADSKLARQQREVRHLASKEAVRQKDDAGKKLTPSKKKSAKPKKPRPE
jgi:DNA-binding transcriptional ArsR family regulator